MNIRRTSVYTIGVFTMIQCIGHLRKSSPLNDGSEIRDLSMTTGLQPSYLFLSGLEPAWESSTSPQCDVVLRHSQPVYLPTNL
jgi:hypothetical protein